MTSLISRDNLNSSLQIVQMSLNETNYFHTIYIYIHTELYLHILQQA